MEPENTSLVWLSTDERVRRFHTNAALREDGLEVSMKSVCDDCGYERDVTEVCLATGMWHKSDEDVIHEAQHEALKLASRMHRVQRELYHLASQPQNPKSPDILWPSIATLELEKTQLIAAARRLGLIVPSHPPPPPVAHSPTSPILLEVDALMRFNNGLKALIEHTTGRPAQLRPVQGSTTMSTI
eukprot:TRINITY_DN38288_c0_g1_i1.p1 TRINITY_DN38288_c0_g1~~TRINITY_DN38288_c0_g1_i1.p1  ORF type:complete len:200 (+),score=50.84 TRINITY_DN38288_c0_g1_i1:44-601(+)